MGLSPETFWAMTLVEWRAALNGHAARRGARTPFAAALGRRELDELIQRFPDSR